MPRLARLDTPRVLHHVMGRGIEHRDIFSSDEDRNELITRLATMAQQGDLDVYAWRCNPSTSILAEVVCRKHDISAGEIEIRGL